MYKQIPVITTNVGAEGLPEINDCLIIEDEPEKFSEKLINMYNDDNLLKDLVKNSYSYLIDNFSIEKMKNIINEDFILGNDRC